MTYAKKTVHQKSDFTALVKLLKNTGYKVKQLIKAHRYAFVGFGGWIEALFHRFYKLAC